MVQGTQMSSTAQPEQRARNRPPPPVLATTTLEKVMLRMEPAAASAVGFDGQKLGSVGPCQQRYR